MAKSEYVRNTRSDRFLLTLHKTGQFCKKIRGKLYYFGTTLQFKLAHFSWNRSVIAWTST